MAESQIVYPKVRGRPNQCYQAECLSWYPRILQQEFDSFQEEKSVLEVQKVLPGSPPQPAPAHRGRLL